MARRFRQQPHQAHGRHTLAAAAFAHDTHTLSASNAEAHIVHGTQQQAVVGFKRNGEITNFQQRMRIHERGSGWAS